MVPAAAHPAAGLVPLWAVVMTVCAPMGSIKWWVAVLLLLLAMAMALPDEQADARLDTPLGECPSCSC